MGWNLEEIYKISIPKWTKFNPRSDRVNFTWLRLQNDFFHDQVIFSLSNNERCFYLLILCMVSKKGCGDIELSISYASSMLKLSNKEIINIINKLHNCHLLVSDGVFTPPKSRATYVRTDGRTNETDMSHAVEAAPLHKLDFDSAYKEYPRKEGKSGGIKICKRDIKTELDFLLLEQAIRNYRLRKTGTDQKYLLMFSTFMNQWRDWLEPETGSSQALKKPDPPTKPIGVLHAEELNPFNPESAKLAEKYGNVLKNLSGLIKDVPKT